VTIHWPTAAFLAFLVILGCTLFPFRFSADTLAGRSIADVLLIPVGPDRSLDVVTNMILFLPLGITLAGLLEQMRAPRSRVLTAALLGGLALSYGMEILQQFIPGRFTSLTDVAANTSGAVIGAIYFELWRTARRTSGRPKPTRGSHGCGNPEEPAHERDRTVQSAHD
jgi:glycopeptide antibiotics resistance protein